MPQFPYIRAATVLAEAHLTSKSDVCQKYNIASGTYDGWTNKLKSDRKLQKLYNSYVEEFHNSWKHDIQNVLRKITEVAFWGLNNHPFEDKPKKVAEKEAWGKNMNAISNLYKSVGDLNVSTYVLLEDDDSEED